MDGNEFVGQLQVALSAVEAEEKAVSDVEREMGTAVQKYEAAKAAIRAAESAESMAAAQSLAEGAQSFLAILRQRHSEHMANLSHVRRTYNQWRAGIDSYRHRASDNRGRIEAMQTERVKLLARIAEIDNSIPSLREQIASDEEVVRQATSLT